MGAAVVSELSLLLTGGRLSARSSALIEWVYDEEDIRDDMVLATMGSDEVFDQDQGIMKKRSDFLPKTRDSL